MKGAEILVPAGVAVAEALHAVAWTTIKSHRQDTHQSLELSQKVNAFAKMVLNTTGVNPKVWAAVHLIHHQLRDANLAPIIELADFIEYQSAHTTGLRIPDVFTGLDPVAHLTPDDVLAIGGLARREVAGRYKIPDQYNSEDGKRLLDPTNPRYCYEQGQPNWVRRRFGKAGATATGLQQPQADLYRLLPELRDPHSPALHPQGVRGVLFHNVKLYRDAADYFKDINNRPPHLQEGGEKASYWWMVGYFALNIAAAAAKWGGLQPRDILGHAAVGSAMTLGSYAIIILGGNITNSFGHGGENPFQALFTGNLRPKPDGTFSTRSRLLSPPTLDEVGGQEPHHDDPWRIAYTLKDGWQGILEAPFGKGLEGLANHAIGMKPGPGFDLKPGERRPDLASEAVLALEAIRVRTMATAAA